MQKRTKVLTAVGAVLLIAAAGAAGTAYAHKRSDWSRGYHGHGEHHRMGGGHGMGRGSGEMAKQFADRYDANKDGKITQDEIDENRANWLSEFDSNKDSSLSIDEFQNLWLKARREMMVREFQQFDRDGDGQVTLEEYQRPLKEIVERLDRNGDGVLSKEDRKKWRDRMHEHHDRNRDEKEDSDG